MINVRLELDTALAALVSDESPVLADIRHALGTDSVRTFYVRPETVFDADSVYDRIVAFIVTERRLLLVYSDTNYEMDARGEYVTTMQSIRLSDIKEYHVVLRREFQGERVGELNSILLRLRWGQPSIKTSSRVPARIPPARTTTATSAFQPTMICRYSLTGTLILPTSPKAWTSSGNSTQFWESVNLIGATRPTSENLAGIMPSALAAIGAFDGHVPFEFPEATRACVVLWTGLATTNFVTGLAMPPTCGPSVLIVSSPRLFHQRRRPGFQHLEPVSCRARRLWRATPSACPRRPVSLASLRGTRRGLNQKRGRASQRTLKQAPLIL